MNTIQPIAFDNGTISIVASDNTYDHAYEIGRAHV